MSRRSALIALVCFEASLWLLASRMLFLPYTFVVGSVAITLFQVINLGALALALIIGMMSSAWQGAIALNLIANAPTIFVMALFGRIGSNLDTVLLSFVASLAVLGWCGWLLRFVRAELADRA